MSRYDTRIVEDRSVTFRHQDNKMNESWIMLIYSNLKKLFLKRVWCRGVSPHSCAWAVANGYGTCCCYLLSMVVDFMLLSDIYCFLFWVGRWYLLSTCVLYWPLLVFVFLLFVECSKRANNFDSSATLARLQHNQISGWAIVPSSDWILSFTSWCLEVRTRTISFTYFSFLDTLSLVIWE